MLELPAPAEGGPPEEVLGVTATAWLLDGDSNPIPAVTFVGAAIAPGGDVAQQEVGLASHFLRATKSDSAEKVFAWLSDACSAGSELSRRARSPNEARPDSSDLGPYRREYYARMLRHGVSLATVDGRITLDELRQFVGMADLGLGWRVRRWGDRGPPRCPTAEAHSRPPRQWFAGWCPGCRGPAVPPLPRPSPG